MKVRVTAPPVHGKANEAVLEALSRALGLRSTAVRIVRGASSPTKLVEIDLDSLDEVRRRLLEEGH